MDRILTTHVGSLIRPPELLDVLGKIERGAPYDQKQYEQLLRGTVDDIADVQQALEGVEHADAFLPVGAPASGYWLENEHYGSEEEFVCALADALQEEYKTLVDAGFLLQVDDAVLVDEADSVQSLGG